MCAVDEAPDKRGIEGNMLVQRFGIILVSYPNIAVRDVQLHEAIASTTSGNVHSLLRSPICLLSVRLGVT